MKLKQPSNSATIASTDTRLLVRETLRISSNLASAAPPYPSAAAVTPERQDLRLGGLANDQFVDSSLRVICCEEIDGRRWRYFAENDGFRSHGSKKLKKNCIRAVSLQSPQAPVDELMAFIRSYVAPEGFPDSVTPSYVPYMTWRALKDTFYGFAGLSKPHSTIRYTVKKLLDLKEKKTVDLLNAIAEQKQLLASRYKHLKQTLESCGWEVVEGQAGVSIVAKPSFYLGKTIKMHKDSSGIQEIKLDDSNIREAMIKTTGLCINSAAWTGIPGYCRFTIGLEDGDFKRALDCIAKFKSLVDN